MKSLLFIYNISILIYSMVHRGLSENTILTDRLMKDKTTHRSCNNLSHNHTYIETPDSLALSFLDGRPTGTIRSAEGRQ